MAAKTRKTDPLSRYFQDLNEDELSNSDEDDEEYQQPAASSLISKKNSNISKNESGDTGSAHLENKKEKLPSANECLGSQNKPIFLQVLDKTDLNWDALEKRLAGEEGEIFEYKTNAVPPPPSYEPITDPGIKVVDKEGRKSLKRKTSENESSSKAYKIHRENDDE